MRTSPTRHMRMRVRRWWMMSRSVLQGVEVLAKVQPPTAQEIGAHPSRRRRRVIAWRRVATDLGAALTRRGVTLFALERVPRITRAQSMDVLSSQSTVAGYKAVLLAASELPRLFPMLTTAAGSLAPAKVFVLGAGVAGLQAIATARRLGAVVSAFDVRAVAREQVQSLGRDVRRGGSPERQTEKGRRLCARADGGAAAPHRGRDRPTCRRHGCRHHDRAGPRPRPHPGS